MLIATIAALVSLIAPITSKPVDLPKLEYKILIVGDTVSLPPLSARIQGGENILANLTESLNKYDLVVANLETNVSGDSTGKKAAKTYTFKSPPAMAGMLHTNNIRLVSLANNHTMDFGEAAFLEQMQILPAAGVMYFGGGKTRAEAFAPKLIKLRNNSICFVGLNNIAKSFQDVRSNRAGSAYLDEKLIREHSLKSECGIKIAYVHWGDEQTTKLSTPQKTWGKKLIDMGFDLVIGAHPHVVQSVEEYKGKKIYYSLGNFLFPGQQFNPKALQGLGVEVTVKDNKIIGLNNVNFQLSDGGIPSLAN